ncbi:MAG: DUF3237 domain-containing protein [Gammaproteobacteria bacterium]|nr:DUF3237 domain-containing protein [Gammaproteobacteria bacterium]NNM10772.1 DUF3237 domain-containing protein [Pseudomonadales bacterium]
MKKLPHTHLATLQLVVDFGAIISIGETPAGIRRIAPVTSGNFFGERLNGTVLPGADWVINRPDGVMIIDVRLLLKTDDSAFIYLTYQGRFLAGPEAMSRMREGLVLDPEEYSIAMNARFESGDEKYKWLNDVVAVGTGEQTASGPIYTIYQIE